MTVKQLPPLVQTPDQLQFCTDELRRYGEELAQAGRRAAVATGTGRAPASAPVSESEAASQPAALSDSSRALLALLPDEQQVEAAAVGRLAEQLEGLARTAPTVHLSLAAAPPAGLRAELAQWFRQAVHPATLLAFHVNPELAGGMTLRTLSRTYDFSFRTPLLARTDALIGLLGRA